MTTQVERDENLRTKTEEQLEQELQARVAAEKAKRTEAYIQEAREEPLVPEELAKQGYIEQIERKPERDLPTPPTDDQGQPLVTPADDQPTDPIILPMTKKEFESGIQEETWTSLRWLAEWCLYVIKKFGGRVFFKG